MAHRNKRAYRGQAGQHSRLDGERDLWRASLELEHLSCKPGELLTSMLTIEFDLNGSGQPKQEQSAGAGYRLKSLRALFNKTQNTTVMRTSPTAVRDVNQGGSIDPPETGAPPNTFTATASPWLEARELKG